MSVEELQKLFEELNSQGASREDIAGALYLMFQEDKLNVEQLGATINMLGFELTPEFQEMTPEQQKTQGWEELDEGEGDNPNKDIPKETAEHEQKEQKEEKEPQEDEEEEEKKKAFKMMGL